jgi:hypothetical protein
LVQVRFVSGHAFRTRSATKAVENELIPCVVSVKPYLNPKTDS